MNLYFKTLGEGKPLIILHGLFGSGDNWLTLAKQWAESYKVYLVDQRNHGHSPFADEMNYEVMSEDLYEFFASEGLRDVYLIARCVPHGALHGWKDSAALCTEIRFSDRENGGGRYGY